VLGSGAAALVHIPGLEAMVPAVPSPAPPSPWSKDGMPRRIHALSQVLGIGVIVGDGAAGSWHESQPVLDVLSKSTTPHAMMSPPAFVLTRNIEAVNGGLPGVNVCKPSNAVNVVTRGNASKLTKLPANADESVKVPVSDMDVV